MLKRTFEATRFYGHDFDDAARYALWLESRGLPGISSVLQEAEVLSSRVSTSPAMNIEENGGYDIDCRGMSLFDVVLPATDLAISAARRKGLGHVRISGSSGPLAIMPSVSRGSELGYATAAWWFDEHDERVHVARAKGEGEDPDYAVLDSDHPGNPNSVEFICSSAFEQLQRLVPDAVNFGKGDELVQLITGAEFEKRFKASVDQGIQVSEDEYRSLCEIADRVLVESNEQSRRGAGS